MIRISPFPAAFQLFFLPQKRPNLRILMLEEYETPDPAGSLRWDINMPRVCSFWYASEDIEGFN